MAPITDPLLLLDQLTEAEIRQRLDQLTRQERALRVLLRSVVARDRAARRHAAARDLAPQATAPAGGAR
jgi:hypothetical protein